MNGEKIIIIVGPTASGKSELAVKLAKKVGGEIISADSRQIYKGLDIGSGKVEGHWRQSNYYYKGVRHHLIDVVDPKKTVSSAQFQGWAKKAVRDILNRGNVPIICGGTAHWIDAVVYSQKFPKVKPDARLRAKLEKKSAAQLFRQLKKLDPTRASTIDSQNPRRLVRALEIVLTTGKPVPQLVQKSKYNLEWIGIKVEQDKLAKKIDKRLHEWLKQGLLHEIETLHEQGVSWEQFYQFGLDYKFGAQYLQGQITYEEMVQQSALSIKRYAKRQMTWWKRNKDIKWRSKK